MGVTYTVPIPATVPTRDVRFSFVTPTGKGTIQLPWPPLYDATGLLILPAGSATVTLVNGVETAALPITDTATITPLDWVYEPRMNVAGMPDEGYILAVPAGVGTLEFTTAVQVGTGPTGGSTVYATLAALLAHTTSTTNVHGIADTADLETDAGAQAKADQAQANAIAAAANSAAALYATLINLAATDADVDLLAQGVATLDAAVQVLGGRVLAIENGTATLAGLQVANGNATITNGSLSATGSTSTATLGGKNFFLPFIFAGRMTFPGPPVAGATWNTGDIVLDSNARWWLCTAGGDPGTWTGSP